MKACGAHQGAPWKPGKRLVGAVYTHRMSARNPSRPAGRRQPVPPCIDRLTLRQKRWLELDDQFAIGEGGAALLRDVGRVGSLAEAARLHGWSYRHAWGYVRRAEGVLGVPLVSTRPGKGRARGAELTSHALEVIAVLLSPCEVSSTQARE